MGYLLFMDTLRSTEVGKKMLSNNNKKALLSFIISPLRIVTQYRIGNIFLSLKKICKNMLIYPLKFFIELIDFY